MSKPRDPLSTYMPQENYPASIPSEVVKAMQIQFDLNVTAYLTSVQYGEGEVYLKGIIFGDKRQRFVNGTAIFTSPIISVHELQGYLFAHTLNSSYVICDWAGAGAEKYVVN